MIGLSPEQRMRLRWVGWFALLNAGVLALIGSRYFSGFTPGGTLLSWVYLVLIYSGHYLLLAVGPLFVLLTPLALLLRSRRLLTFAGAVIMSLMIAVILLDSLLWADSRFHLNALTAQILGWQSWVFSAGIFFLALWFQHMLAAGVWRWVENRSAGRGRWIALGAVAAVLGGQFIYAWADASYYVPVTSVGQQLPVYKGFTAKRRLVDWGLVDPEASREREVARRLARQLDDPAARILNYPRAPLQCTAGGGERSPMNLVMILADAMRSDRLNEIDSPRLVEWGSRRGQVFEQHFSGGNSSRMGVFSFFYGLPPGYWSTFESLQRPSVLIDELQRQNYQLGLFSSSTMYRPVALDRTAFARVSGLRLESEPRDAPSWIRDQVVNDDWWAWLDQRDESRPFFGFLFYNSSNAMVYPDDWGFSPELAADGLSGLQREFVDYRRSIVYVDHLIDQVLSDLQSRRLLDQTVVVISSDHGEEFDETGAGLTKHGSGYTTYQLQVPLIVLWPGLEPRRFTHRTSHYDLLPTLMSGVLGCTNEAADYSSGRNLFSEVDWDWVLAGSYYNYAVLEADQLTITYPNGSYEMRRWDYQLIQDPVVNGELLQAVTRENSRFYR